MKKVYSILVLFMAVFSLISCGKEEKLSDAAADVKDSVEKTNDLAEYLTAPCTVLYETGHLWVEDEYGLMEWKKSVFQGTELRAVKSASDTLEPVTKKARRSTDKDDANPLEFVQVVYNSEIMYVIRSSVIFEAFPGLIKPQEKPVFLYKTPDVVNIMSVKITEDTICASPAYDGSGFRKVSVITGGKLYKDVYVNADDVSFSTKDIITFQIGLKKKYEKNQNVIEELDRVNNDMLGLTNGIEPELKTFFDKPESYKVIMLQKDGSLWKKNAEGDMVWKVSVIAGTVLEVEDGQIIQAARISGKDRKEGVEFLAVKYNGESLFVQADRVAYYNHAEAVILEESMLYSMPDPLNCTPYSIPKGSIVQAEKLERFSGFCNFYKIKYLDPRWWAVKEAYVEDSYISISKKDVETSLLLEKFENEKDIDIKKEMIISAAKSAQNPLLSQIVESYRRSLDLEVIPVSQAAILEEGAEGVNSVIINQDQDDKILIFKEPTIVSNVAGEFVKGTTVVITHVTKNGDEAIGGYNWYKVTAQADSNMTGWISQKFVEWRSDK